MGGRALLMRKSTWPHSAITVSAKRRSVARIGNIAGKARAGLFVDDADARAVFAELPGDAPADALRAAGDDGYLILKHALPSMGVFCHIPPPHPLSCRMGEKT